MEYKNMASGLGPNIFGIYVDVEWTPMRWGVRVTVRDVDEGEPHKVVHHPDAAIQLTSVADGELNATVRAVLGPYRKHCSIQSWIDDPVTVAYELADHGDLNWVPEKLAK
ncbi:hypothetical protein SMD44_07350 [Streptomyces alboflavus]|uniref:Uncharacterized protein n=1 Tax=Streptomyces alboflavus TaxID=67267 RepID=A0A1Z1WN89_9ACTN|nr:hypothetical protein [Streptomyces alboflavus]ARX87868.1 hypothetical protein SMD44_07350 [Streptomyces alboflavus]